MAKTPFCIYCVNSLVGDKTNACVSSIFVSNFCSIDIENIVPDYACVITSRSLISRRIVRCFIADGYSKP